MGSNKIKTWTRAFRPHTLPLAFAALLLGNAAALAFGKFDFWIGALSVITALLLQILSNLANDYGDSLHGADTEKRIGPERAVQSGAVSPKAMKRMVFIFIGITVLSGTGLLLMSVKNTGWGIFFIMFGVGLLAIWAAYSYTASKNPYGYRGLGDLFVFVFFGLVAVLGVFYLQTGTLNVKAIWPAAAIGFWSSGVLNLNNVRDLEGDKSAGKRTLPVLLGFNKARAYHLFLITSGAICFLVFVNFLTLKPWQWVFALPILGALFHLKHFYQAEDTMAFYPLLKQLSILSLLVVASLALLVVLNNL